MTMTSLTRMRKMCQFLEYMTANRNEKEIPESAAWKIATAWDLLQDADSDIQKQLNKEWKEEAIRKTREKKVPSKISSVKLTTDDFYEDDDDDDED